jgi:hypothetical protein
MSLFNRLHYFRRIFHAYFGAGNSQLSFWHDQPAVNENFTVDELGEYYMPFLEKADYAGTFDDEGKMQTEYWCGTITLIGSTALHCVPHGIPHWRRDRVFRC